MLSTRCPTRADLSIFLSGKLSEEQIDAIGIHLEDCGPCQALLETLDDPEDTLSPQLRHRQGINTVASDSQLQLLLKRAKEIGLEVYGIGDPSSLPGQPVPTPRPTGEGSQLDQYRLLEKIGQGGMGAVYKALHLRLEKVVALKVLPPGRTQDSEALARFQREIRAAGKLNHPNIITATDAREAGGVHFLVMELLDGADLAQFVRRLGPLPVSDACELVRQAAEGLQHAHEHGMVHRDVKPSNLMLCRDGRVKVLDLGLARLRGDAPAADELTGSGQMMGTLDYMAPEQGSDARSVDIRADVYSLGCTLYHLLAGQAPFAEHTHPAKKLLAHMSEPPPPIRAPRSPVPVELAALVERMLAKQPQQRPGTPGEVARLLRPFTAGADLAGLFASRDTAPLPREALAPAEAGSSIPHKSTVVTTPPLIDQTNQPFPKSINKGESMPPAPTALPVPRHANKSLSPLVIAATVVAGLALAAAAWWILSGQRSSPPTGNGSSLREFAKADEGKDSAKDGSTPTDPDASAKKDPEKGDSSPKESEKTSPKDSEPEKEPAKTPPAPKLPADQLAQKGVDFLKTYCYRCHGVDFKVPGLNVMDRAVLIAKRKDEMPYLTPGKLEQSLLWQRVGVDSDMPPSKPLPSDADKEVLKQWIAAGAPYPGRPARPFNSEKDVLTAIRDHLRKTDRDDRKFQRYFTLTHLFNNNQHVSTDEMFPLGVAKSDLFAPSRMSGLQRQFRPGC